MKIKVFIDLEEYEDLSRRVDDKETISDKKLALYEASNGVIIKNPRQYTGMPDGSKYSLEEVLIMSSDKEFLDSIKEMTDTGEKVIEHCNELINSILSIKKLQKDLDRRHWFEFKAKLSLKKQIRESILKE